MNVLIVGRGSIAQKHKLNIESFNMSVTLLSEIIKNDINNEDLILDSFRKSLHAFDAVVIANSTHKHFTYAAEAIKQDKKIYLEKPPCLKLDEIKKLLKLYKKSNSLIAIGFQMRFSNGLIKLKNLIEKNKSEIISFDIHVGQTLRNWRDGGIIIDRYYSDRNKGGGALYELSHEIDLAIWMFGMPNNFTYVNSNLLHKNMNIDDYFHSIWEYDEICGVVHLDMIDPSYKRHVEVNFNKYKLIWNIENDSLLKEDDSGIEIIYKNLNFKRQDLLHISIQNFIKCLDGEEKWKGASLDESVPLIHFFEDVHYET